MSPCDWLTLRIRCSFFADIFAAISCILTFSASRSRRSFKAVRFLRPSKHWITSSISRCPAGKDEYQTYASRSASTSAFISLSISLVASRFASSSRLFAKLDLRPDGI